MLLFDTASFLLERAAWGRCRSFFDGRLGTLGSCECEIIIEVGNGTSCSVSIIDSHTP